MTATGHYYLPQELACHAFSSEPFLPGELRQVCHQAGEGLGREDAVRGQFRAAAEMVSLWRGLDLLAWGPRTHSGPSGSDTSPGSARYSSMAISTERRSQEHPRPGGEIGGPSDSRRYAIGKAWSRDRVEKISRLLRTCVRSWRYRLVIGLTNVHIC